MADAENIFSFFFFPSGCWAEGRWKDNLLAGLLAHLWVLDVNAHRPLSLEDQQAETRVILAHRDSLGWESKNEKKSKDSQKKMFLEECQNNEV